MSGSCSACKQWRILDRAHILTRGAGAGWHDHEWIYLCRLCHQKQGSLGWPKFIDRYPHIEALIKHQGYEIVEEFGIKKVRKA